MHSGHLSETFLDSGRQS
uniref:Uncharacterized protein n=1 Tax=Tetraselmis sp. GSL018 TaxID=582737 RepID=A0A061QYI6_9CHLO